MPQRAFAGDVADRHGASHARADINADRAGCGPGCIKGYIAGGERADVSGKLTGPSCVFVFEGASITTVGTVRSQRIEAVAARLPFVAASRAALLATEIPTPPSAVGVTTNVKVSPSTGVKVPAMPSVITKTSDRRRPASQEGCSYKAGLGGMAFASGEIACHSEEGLRRGPLWVAEHSEG